MSETEKNEILSLSKDLGETAIDSLLEDGLFKDVPVIGIGISVARLINSVSDRILLTKIIHFINNLNLRNQKEIDEFKRKYFKLNDYKKIGSTLLLILEKADSDTKILWLSKSLNLLIDNVIDKPQFLKLSSIINSAFIEDVFHIKIFKTSPEITSNNDFIESYVLDHMFSIGLLQTRGLDGGYVEGGNSGTIYILNTFGKIMMDKIV